VLQLLVSDKWRPVRKGNEERKERCVGLSIHTQII
jgi:hypothetical protein